ncbi:MAG: M20/M25/M40 family metallo-hydrolase [Oscillospiraceae bacterium]|nr:M20/M25/M40 family metallo-hydrolase [Oscillospiraceae bacterium]
MKASIKEFVQQNEAALLQTLRQLCAIPAPSHQEEKRAAYCKSWLEKAGAKGVYIDEALNVVFPLNCEGSNDITVYVAHTDTVFPDTEPMPLTEDDIYIRCPGVGDDTASLTVLLMLAKYCIEKNIRPKKGILFVCNSCEEGLGNLKGTRQIFRDYAGRIGRFISLDSNLNTVADRCVGSHRYEVEVRTEGGHSFGAFGNDNAIHELSKMVTKIYQIQVPQIDGSKTTYNVGDISGGTSVNTIAQSARMLCEYRSDNVTCLAIMEEKFAAIFREAEAEKIRVLVKRIGERPCQDIDPQKIEDLKALVVPQLEAVIGQSITFKSSSTDCNIPLSMGIPALCIGVYRGGGAHTREEWIEKHSMVPGLEAAIRVALTLEETV